jgi:CDP-glucose 4,6-dehydratase
MLDRAFWKERRVLLTGHTGFKGSWLSIWLNLLGAEVTGFALEPPTEPNLFNLAAADKGIRSVHGDIRDFSHLKRAIFDCRPEVIIHMAAQSVVRRGYEDPIETYSSNVMGTVHLFEALRHLHHRCVVVNVTTDKCYENREWVWGYREDEPMGGRDPYSNSKGCAELVTAAFRDSYFAPAAFQDHGVAIASARAGNVIGGGDWTPNQLVPDLIRAFLKGDSCLIRNPVAIRPWQFVLEPLRGYLMLAERLHAQPTKFSGAWNFGPVESDAKPVSWIADNLVRLWGGSAGWVHDTGTYPHEAHYLKLDASKAKAYLEWQPLLPLREALDWIVEWYRAFQTHRELREIVTAQIERYQELA